MKNKFLLILSIILFSTLVSANGLTIFNQSQTFINKTDTETKNITFILRNEEPNTFFNIDFEPNPSIDMDEIEELASGSNISVTAKVKGNQDFDGQIRIKGFYNSSLEPLFEQHFINVDYSNGFDICDINIVKGDSVTWRNDIDSSSGNIRLINANSGQEFASINSLSNHTEAFNEPLVLNYYATRVGVPFTQVCRITVLDTSGLINDPSLDALLPLNLDIVFQPTTISLDSFTTSFEVEIGSSVEDILKITNTGNNIAKNIRLDGEWFFFDENNFDLAAGKSRNVGYRVSPTITNTNQTNQTHTKNIVVSGNFVSFNKSFDIFVPFTNIITSQNDTVGLRDRIDFYAEVLISYCSDFPEDTICRNLLTSNSLSQFQQNITASPVSLGDFLGFARSFIDFTDRLEPSINTLKEQDFDIQQNQQNISQQNVGIEERLSTIEDQTKNSSNTGWMINTITIMIMLLAVVGWIIFTKKKQLFIEQFSQYK